MKREIVESVGEALSGAFQAQQLDVYTFTQAMAVWRHAAQMGSETLLVLSLLAALPRDAWIERDESAADFISRGISLLAKSL